MLVGFTAPAWFRWVVGAENYKPAELKAIDYSYVPRELFDAVLWGISAVLLHVGALYAALRIRDRKMRAKVKRWDGKNTSPILGKETRPYGKYLWVSAIGGLVGWSLLLIPGIVFVDKFGEVVPGDVKPFGLFAERMLASFCFFFLAMTTTFFALYHHDTSGGQSNLRTEILWALLQAIITAAFSAGASVIFLYLHEEVLTPVDFHDAIEVAFISYGTGLAFFVGGFLGWFVPFRRRALFRSNILGEWEWPQDGVALEMDENNRGQSKIILRIEINDEDSHVEDSHVAALSPHGCEHNDMPLIGDWKYCGHGIQINFDEKSKSIFSFPETVFATLNRHAANEMTIVDNKKFRNGVLAKAEKRDAI